MLQLEVKHLKKIIEENNKYGEYQVYVNDLYETQKIEKELEERNHQVISMLIQQYWVGPLRRKLAAWDPVQGGKVFEIFQKWQYIIPES